ncbi:MAG TPA: hypothetical protein PLJ27_24990 [Polyangiaceae bacterium]|jgi:hypothetical protein|nr:MAG: hypothetical protein BWY17_04462 [Deltaproteobacteria bacterium ADurb.Bin207]HNS97763.1 hypothetical protein [Polyangiaceae bacterium]HNZ25214.1 hypothetical protein [Polyangiaceae bacterium]HOD25095.1 hypothetical protein [Polyangiaceae bacterium]HOE51769.1 hypothetical protein [Polyangiaceae bacterium]
MKHATCQRILGIDLVDRSDKTPAAVLNGSKNQDLPPHGEPGLDEQERTELISTIVTVIRRRGVPPHVHQAALTLMGWLARRKICEHPCQTGVAEAHQQSLRMTSSRR